MRIAILGSGLIGGSIGLAAKARIPEVEVVAFDLDAASAAAAVARGAADEAAGDVASAVADADLVFVATPVSAIAPTALAALSSMSAGAILTDVGSTKSRVVLEVEQASGGVHFIGGHPMAGTEEEGVGAADADLFAGAWWILTPTERNEPSAYGRLHSFLTTLGARVMAMRPGEHDELIAVISHLPQLIASSLMHLAAERGRDHAGLLELAAGGFRDVTRIAASNPTIWVDVCRENAPALSAALRGFSQALDGLADQVERGDVASIERLLVSARAARRQLREKAVEGDPFVVRMPIPDRPGVLAEVTTTVGNAGINIEDLQISHAVEGGRGVLHLVVAGESAASRVVDALAAKGFDAKVMDP